MRGCEDGQTPIRPTAVCTTTSTLPPLCLVALPPSHAVLHLAPAGCEQGRPLKGKREQGVEKGWEARGGMANENKKTREE